MAGLVDITRRMFAARRGRPSLPPEVVVPDIRFANVNPSHGDVRLARDWLAANLRATDPGMPTNLTDALVRDLVDVRVAGLALHAPVGMSAPTSIPHRAIR